LPDPHTLPFEQPILLVFGPTASGKTGLSIELAKRFDGEVINADSMQAYAGLPLLTALPDEQEQDGVPHHLFGEIAADQRCSTGKWLRHCTQLIEQVRKRGKRPVLVGGTGLYFEALTRGLAKIPKITPETEQRIHQIAENEGLDQVRRMLEQVDPEAARRILGADRQRLERALCVFEQTGTSITAFQQNTVPVLSKDDWTGLVLLPDRDILYERINARLDQMLKNGALDELKEFLRLWPKPDTSLSKAIGVRPLSQYLNGEMELDAAISLAKRDTRRYAKRQMTWARGRTDGWQHFSDPKAAMQAV
jgi:tRNA dimethylallyltransferase